MVRLKQIKTHRKLLTKQLKIKRKATMKHGSEENGYVCQKCNEEIECRNEVRKHFRMHYQEIDDRVAVMERGWKKDVKK